MLGFKTFVTGFALMGVGLAVSPAQAQVQDTASYSAALQALIDEIGEPGKANVAPAATDPIFARAVREAEALRATIGTPRLPITGLATMSSLCGPPLTVMQRFFDIGLDARVKKATTDAERKAITDQLETQNAGRYADTVLPFMLLNVRCNASHMPVIETFLAAIPADRVTPTQLSGVGQIRGGANDQAQGLIQGISDPAASEARRQRMLGELVRDIDLFAIALTPAQKAGVTAAVVKLRPTLSPAGKVQADAVTAALAKSGCGRVCSAVVPAG